MNLTPQEFFDISSFSHKELFEGIEYVWEALGKISPYLKKQKLGLKEIQIPQNVFLEHAEQISIGEGTVIEPGAFIRGPCIIGKNCVIRHGAYIRGDFIAGDSCVIGHDTEVKNTIFLNSAHAAHFAYLGDSILGNKTNLGAGVKCANLKLNNDQIIISIDEKKIKTGLRKFGAIIGDDTQIGCNTVTNPGTIMGKGVRCYPCMNVGGVIPSHHLVKCNTKIEISLLK